LLFGVLLSVVPLRLGQAVGELNRQVLDPILIRAREVRFDHAGLAFTSRRKQ